MDIKKILDLLSKKHPTDYKRGINPAIFIYDDGSGKIVRDALVHPYENRNFLFEFSTVDELVDYLNG